MLDKVLGNLKRGLLFVVSAPAGTGKTTLVRMLTQEFPSVVASISCTTRPPRPGEIHGVHYFFLNNEEFLSKLNSGDFFEHVELYGYYYGTSYLWMEEQIAQGKHVVLVIDTQGALLIKGKLPGAMIFLSPPSLEELKNRLIKRNTDSSESLEKRLKWAEKEMERQIYYDYCIVNKDLQVAYQVLRSIFIAEEHKLR